MRGVFDSLFEQVGEQLYDHLKLQPVTTLARHAWSGGKQLDLYADVAPLC
jgi:1-hydroxycarotenoid 3,4-desaturase